MAYIAIAIIRVNEVEGRCDLIHRTCRGSKSGLLEHGTILWERVRKVGDKKEMLFSTTFMLSKYLC
jgi:hypothetical protein